MRLSTYDKPGEHGAVVSNQLYSGRTIQLPGRISGQTIPDYNIRRRTLQNALRIIKDANAVSQAVLMQFQTDDDLLLQAYVYLQQAIQMPESSPNHAQFVLQLYAPDQNFYSQSLSSYNISLPSFSGLVYPVIYPVIYPASIGGQVTLTNGGDVNSPFQLTFNGPLTSPFITNLTTGETFATNITLNAGDQLMIDMGQKTMVLNGASNALSSFVLTNTWMQLIPGDNIFKLGSGLSSDAGSATVNFRSAYFGI